MSTRTLANTLFHFSFSTPVWCGAACVQLRVSSTTHLAWYTSRNTATVYVDAPSSAEAYYCRLLNWWLLVAGLSKVYIEGITNFRPKFADLCASEEGPDITPHVRFEAISLQTSMTTVGGSPSCPYLVAQSRSAECLAGMNVWSLEPFLVCFHAKCTAMRLLRCVNKSFRSRFE